MPLIDLPPAQHDTKLTSLVKGLSFVKNKGNDVLIFTADQQIYKTSALAAIAASLPACLRG